jgi:hypothetical protein
LNPLQVNETVVAAEYFYCRAFPMILVCRYIPDTQPAHADIPDLPHVKELIGLDESGKGSFFAFKPLEFSFVLKHFFTLPDKGIPGPSDWKSRKISYRHVGFRKSPLPGKMPYGLIHRRGAANLESAPSARTFCLKAPIPAAIPGTRG